MDLSLTNAVFCDMRQILMQRINKLMLLFVYICGFIFNDTFAAKTKLLRKKLDLYNFINLYSSLNLWNLTWSNEKFY